jgi:hypothetical protein
MENWYEKKMRNSRKYLPVAMSCLSSSLMLPERTVQTINQATASWLEAERGGRGACHEVPRCPPITAAASVWPGVLDRVCLTVTFGALAGWKGLVRKLRELQT